jgi:hypothetical protein
MASDTSMDLDQGNTAANSGNQESDLLTGIDLGNVYRQCSTARIASSTMTFSVIKDGSSSSHTQTAPPIGTLNWDGDKSVLRTFHGGRISKNGRPSNECVSSSYDPRNLHCIGCEKPHVIFNPLKPPVLIFSDQNFVPFLAGGPENCIAVFRAENPTLSELADLAGEVLEKTPLPAGTSLLFGSGSHLFKVGASQYAADWIHLANRGNQKWPNSNICPLVPVIRSDAPGSIVRDIGILADWLGRVYANSTTGLLDTWKHLLQFAESQCTGTDNSEVCKVPLPTSISVGSTQTHCYVFHSSCPDMLHGMDRKATNELLRVLIETLNRDFSTNLNPDIIVEKSWAGNLDAQKSPGMSQNQTEQKKHAIVIGASNMRRLVPFLKSAGFTVSDLSQPSWLATPENIELLTEKLNTIAPDPNTVIILELHSNSTFRYRQFDGTMALPYKTSTGYHMGGDVGVCDDEAFVRLTKTAGGLLETCGECVKILIPPLPRYLYTGCCSSKSHCTNRSNEDYELSLLQATTHFRPLLKDTLLRLGLEKFYVIDGIGAVLGVPPGENRGAPIEILKELTPFYAPDGVHLLENGYANMSRTIVAAVAGIASGTLLKPKQSPNISGKNSGGSYFWRGFISPVGYGGAKLLNAAAASCSWDGGLRKSGNRGCFSVGGGNFAQGGRGYRGGRGGAGGPWRPGGKRGGGERGGRGRYNPYF